MPTARGIFFPALLLGAVSFFTAVFCPSARCAHDAFSLVAAAVRAKHTVSFQAKQEIWLAVPKDKPGSPGNIHIVADVIQAGPVVRLTYALPRPVSGRVVLDNGQMVRQWDQQHRLILNEQSHSESADTQRQMLRLFHKNYISLSLGEERVNDLWCDKIDVRPRHGHSGPRRVMWIEKKRHAVLRAAEYDSDGTCSYLSFYVQFCYLNAAPSETSRTPSGMKSRWVGPREVAEPTFSAAFTKAALAGRLPCWLPDGYALVSCSVILRSRGQRSVALNYGDGLKMVTVIESAFDGSSDHTPLRMRPTAALSEQEMWAGNLHLALMTDPSVPESVGTDIMQAFAPQTESRLTQAIAKTFGPRSLPLARRLRGEGWGYDEIIARCLLPHKDDHLHRTEQPVPVSRPSFRREQQARRWIAATVNPY